MDNRDSESDVNNVIQEFSSINLERCERRNKCDKCE